MASFDTPKAVGEYVGRVVRVEKNRFRLDRGGLLAAGDGICFLTDRGFAGTNVNAADGDCVTPNRMKVLCPGRRSTAITTTVSTSSSPAAVRAA